MVVQHNMTAINANRYFGINNNKLSKSLEKLSSGYAINRAGDNAAGLAVSEKMRSQIAGINQGVKNAQDGISMVQTYEGALTETDSILQRMKTLATQSANGTYQSDVDRDAIQLEFNQLNDELNQIADTDFNGVVALNGGVMSDGTVVNNTKVVSSKPSIEYTQNGTGDNSIVYSESVNGTVDAAGNGSINVNGVRVELVAGASQTAAGAAGPYTPDGAGDKSSYTVEEVKVGANGKFTEKEDAITAVEEFKVGEDDTTVTVYGNTYTIQRADDGTIEKLLNAAGDEVDVTKDGFEVGNLTKTGFTATSTYKIDEDGNITNKDTGAAVGTVKLSNGVSTSDSYNHGATNLTYADSITLQVGAHSKDSVNFNFAYTTNGIGTLKSDLDVSARGLGTDQLSLATQEKANFAIDKIDNAINKVSMVRGTFGAVQNRLEHKIDNLNTTSENLTSAESRIRDTNMAEEMMNFTKNQILSQASQSMLAQANQLPQGVLSLLQ